MTKLLEAPTSDYLLAPASDHLHEEAIEWLSDLEFCRTELSFLTKLLDKTFLRVKGAQKLSDLNVLEKKVKSFRSKALKKLHDEVIRHEQHLAALNENMFSGDEQPIREEHKICEAQVKSFMSSVKKIKKEIFEVAEKQLKQTKK